MTTLALERPQVGWSFWLQWVIVMTMFASLSYTSIDTVLGPIVTQFVYDPWVQEATIVLGLAVLGAAFGITQWLLLRRHLHRASTWGLASAATFWVGASSTEIAFFSGVALLPSFALNFLLLTAAVVLTFLARSYPDPGGILPRSRRLWGLWLREPER